MMTTGRREARNNKMNEELNRFVIDNDDDDNDDDDAEFNENDEEFVENPNDFIKKQQQQQQQKATNKCVSFRVVIVGIVLLIAFVAILLNVFSLENNTTKTVDYNTTTSDSYSSDNSNNSSIGNATDVIHMETREIGPEVHMPVISIGTGGLEMDKAKEIVSTWLKVGGRGIDTALLYHNQENVQQAILDSGVPREDVFITTKIPTCEKDQQTIMEQIEKDLYLLGTDYVDLMLIHNAGDSDDCWRTWQTLEQYYWKNVCRAIGVSNFRPKDLKPLLEKAEILPAVNQIELNVVDVDYETVNYTTTHGIIVQAYSPLGRSSVHGDDIPHNEIVQSIAKNYGVTTYQIAMKWILQHDWIATFQSSSEKHQIVDVDVFDFTLSDAEMKLLDEISAGGGGS